MRKSLGILIGLIAFACLGVGTASGEVLVDQSGGEALPYGTRSDSYIIPPTAPTMNIRSADDFDVPAGEKWTVNEIHVFGFFDLFHESSQTPPGPPPSQLNVRIYANTTQTFGDPPDQSTLDFPGALVYDSGSVAATGGPDYTVPIPNAPPLSSGRYWISVQQEGAQFFVDDSDNQFTQQWVWEITPLFAAGNQVLMQTDGALTPGCEFAADWPWKPWSCDFEQEQSETLAAAAVAGDPATRSAVTPRGGPPQVNARMVISGNKGGPTGGASPAVARKKCKKHRVRKHGKCVRKKSKAKRVDPGFTG
jgi:hypothetical protein